MKKTYNNAELQIVRLNRKDIVTASEIITFDGTIFNGTADAPDRFYRFDNYWDIGY